MIQPPDDLITRFASFVAERYPYALELTGEAFEVALGNSTETAWRQVDQLEDLRTQAAPGATPAQWRLRSPG